jgi:hypothetical protein
MSGKVYISQIDRPVGQRLGQILSKTLVGPKKEEEQDSQEQTESNDTETAAAALKNGQTFYEVSGSFSAPKADKENAKQPQQAFWQKEVIPVRSFSTH